jgi:rhodanese-related sulfurtransferase
MNSTKNLNNISLLSFGFVAIVVMVNLFTTNNYGLANRKVVENLNKEPYMANYQILRNIVSEENTDYQLIDLRPEQSFKIGYLPGAINIPFDKILEKENLKTIQKLSPKILVLYGEHEATAQSARLLLISKGLDEKIMVLGGNYETAFNHAVKDFDPSFVNYQEEKAHFDFKRYMNTGTNGTPERAPRPAGILPAVTLETQSAAGGC